MNFDDILRCITLMTKKLLLVPVLLALLCIPGITQAEDLIRTIEGIVSKVSDGDTIHVTGTRSSIHSLANYDVSEE